MLYLFNKQEELTKIISSSNIKSAIQTKELKKVISLDAELFNINSDEVKEAEYIGHFERDIFYLYKILRVKTKETTIVKAVYIVFDELKSNGYIRDKRLNNTTSALALSTILEGTRWRVGTVKDNSYSTAYWYDKTRLEALTDLVNNWQVELRYRIDFDGQKIRGRWIDLYKELGYDNGKRIVYGANAIEVTAETNKAGVYTAIIGRGKGEEKTDEEGEATGGFGRRINFKEVEWKKSEGDPVDKPLGQEFIEDIEATNKFGFSNGDPRTKIVIFPDCTNPLELLELSYKKLKEINRPLVTFRTTVKNLGAVDLGDTISVIRRDLDLFYKTRVFKMEIDLLDNSLTKVTLGDYIASNAEKQKIEGKHKLEETTSKITEVETEIGSKINGLLTDLKEGIELSYFNDNAFNYELANNNKWGLPAGYYSFNAPIDSDPSKVIFFGAGKLMIANKKKSDGSWDWSTFGTGDGFTADLIVAGTINGNFIEAGSIKGDRLEARGITADKIAAGTITANEIETRSLTADEIEVGTLTAREIKRKTIEGENIEDKTLDSDHIREIKVDILRPGRNNRIIFEGDDPGDNNAKSIDSTGRAIRLKYDRDNYVFCSDTGIQFYTETGKTWTRNGTFYGDNFNNTSDLRAKENIGYIDGKRRIKPNPNKKVADLTTKEIVSFLKGVKVATYNYKDSSKMQIGTIAQQLEKVPKLGEYLVKEDDNRKYINLNNFINVGLVGLKEALNKIEELERKIEKNGDT